MAIWYEVEHSKEGIYNFMECNCCFHDFAIERVNYTPEENTVELFLKYSTMEDSIILRFLNVESLNVTVRAIKRYTDEIFLSVLFLLDNGHFLWIDDDHGWGEDSYLHIEELKADSSWIEAERIIWAVTDKDGRPTELPDDKIDQTWDICGKIEHHHFSLTPYTE